MDNIINVNDIHLLNKDKYKRYNSFKDILEEA